MATDVQGPSRSYVVTSGVFMHALPIIFLHGFPFNSSSWDDQVSYFNKRYQVYAPDLRGHRTGAAPPGPWMIAHFAKDLLDFMDQKRIRRAIICGLSMGGYIALHFAAKYPDRIAGLILCDTRADADGNEAKDKRFETIQKVQKKVWKDLPKTLRNLC